MCVCVCGVCVSMCAQVLLCVCLYLCMHMCVCMVAYTCGCVRVPGSFFQFTLILYLYRGLQPSMYSCAMYQTLSGYTYSCTLEGHKYNCTRSSLFL